MEVALHRGSCRCPDRLEERGLRNASGGKQRTCGEVDPCFVLHGGIARPVVGVRDADRIRSCSNFQPFGNNRRTVVGLLRTGAVILEVIGKDRSSDVTSTVRTLICLIATSHQMIAHCVQRRERLLAERTEAARRRMFVTLENDGSKVSRIVAAKTQCTYRSDHIALCASTLLFI